MGAIIVVDHFFAKRLGIPTDPAEQSGTSFNFTVLLAWLIPVAVAMYLYCYQDVFASYLPLPTSIACGLLYIVLSKSVGPKPATNSFG
jgi:NCS1 family nucleobase:cation symporter-1